MTATGLFQVALIVLKLLHAIEWSWWLVLCPSWVTVISVVALFVLKVLLR